jgi:hypothetical protein
MDRYEDVLVPGTSVPSSSPIDKIRDDKSKIEIQLQQMREEYTRMFMQLRDRMDEKDQEAADNERHKQVEAARKAQRKREEYARQMDEECPYS